MSSRRCRWRSGRSRRWKGRWSPQALSTRCRGRHRGRWRRWAAGPARSAGGLGGRDRSRSKAIGARESGELRVGRRGSGIPHRRGRRGPLGDPSAPPGTPLHSDATLPVAGMHAPPRPAVPGAPAAPSLPGCGARSDVAAAGVGAEHGRGGGVEGSRRARCHVEFWRAQAPSTPPTPAAPPMPPLPPVPAVPVGPGVPSVALGAGMSPPTPPPPTYPLTPTPPPVRCRRTGDRRHCSRWYRPGRRRGPSPRDSWSTHPSRRRRRRCHRRPARGSRLRAWRRRSWRYPIRRWPGCPPPPSRSPRRVPRHRPGRCRRPCLRPGLPAQPRHRPFAAVAAGGRHPAIGAGPALARCGRVLTQGGTLRSSVVNVAPGGGHVPSLAIVSAPAE